MSAAAPDPIAWLQAQPRAGAAADPARWRTLEALARRAAAAEGPLRTLLLAKLQARCAALQAQALPVPAAPGRARASPLAALLQQLAPGAVALRSAGVDARSWTRLRVQRRLAQVHTPPPQPLGPLNALALLPRAFAALNEASPEYLQRFMVYVDGLAALAPAGPGGPQKAGGRDEVAARRRKPPPRGGA